MRVNKLSGIVIRLAAILMCLVLFSSHLASGMFARYTTGASGTGSSRVAKVDVRVIEKDPLSLDNLGNGSYKFLVKNNSETAFQYVIKLRIASTSEYLSLFSPSGISSACTDVKLTDASGTITGNVTSDDSLYTFAVTEPLKPDSESDVYTLTFKATDLVGNASDSADPFTSYHIPINFLVSVKGIQVN